MPGVFKLSCSTPFVLFLHLVSVYRPFQPYFIPKTLSMIPPFSAPSYSLFLPDRPFFCICLQHSSLHSSCSLRSPSDPACLPCAASRVRGGWDPGGWGPPWGPTRFFSLDFSLMGGWVGPTRSISWSCFALILIRRQWLRVSQGIEVNS